MKLSKQHLVVAGTALTLAILGGVAFAYWTSTGSGSGTATAGTVSSVTLHAKFNDGMLLGESQTVTVTADGNGKEDVNLKGSTLSFTVSTNHSGCTADDFTLASAAASDVVVHKADSGVTDGRPAARHEQSI
jgi:hypothetical protein